MAWVKIKSTNGNTLTVPSYFYEKLYKNNPSFTLVEPIPENKPKQKIEKENVTNGENLQQHKQTERNTPRQNSQKANS